MISSIDVFWLISLRAAVIFDGLCSWQGKARVKQYLQLTAHACEAMNSAHVLFPLLRFPWLTIRRYDQFFFAVYLLWRHILPMNLGLV